RRRREPDESADDTAGDVAGSEPEGLGPLGPDGDQVLGDLESDEELGGDSTSPDVPGTQRPASPSERMGLNPNDGPLSAAATVAVDSGAAPSFPALPAPSSSGVTSGPLSAGLEA